MRKITRIPAVACVAVLVSWLALPADASNCLNYCRNDQTDGIAQCGQEGTECVEAADAAAQLCHSQCDEGEIRCIQQCNDIHAGSQGRCFRGFLDCLLDVNQTFNQCRQSCDPITVDLDLDLDLGLALESELHECIAQGGPVPKAAKAERAAQGEVGAAASS